MKITSRLPEIGTSIFTVMSQLALEEGAINLSQGFPDFKVSEPLIQLIHQKMVEGNNQYAPSPGSLELRRSIALVAEKTYGRKVDPETEITITAGGTEALYSAIAALVGAGDEVIVFDPSYDSYGPAVRLNGGVPVHINLKAPHFGIPWDEVKSKINSRTRMIMVNTPHNPSGAVLSEADMKELESLALHHGLIVLSDEVYERIIFENKAHQSVLRYPALAAQSIAVFSFGKTFHATGWKIGYTVAPEILTREIRKSHQFITFAVNTPIQLALADFLKDPENYIHVGSFYQKKRDYFLEQISGSSFQPLPCFGSYFQVVTYPATYGRSDREMAEWMTREHKLAAIPVSVFYADKTDQRLLRFCFAKGENTLEEAGSIIRKL